MSLTIIEHGGIELPVFDDVIYLSLLNAGGRRVELLSELNTTAFVRHIGINLQFDTLPYFDCLDTLVKTTDQHLVAIANASNGFITVVDHRWGLTPRVQEDPIDDEPRSHARHLLPDGYDMAAEVAKVEIDPDGLPEGFLDQVMVSAREYRQHKTIVMYDAIRPWQYKPVKGSAVLLDIEPYFSFNHLR